MRFTARVVAPVLLLAGEIGAVAGLHRLGTRQPFDLGLDPDAWQQARPADALAAALRWLALGAACWLLLATVLSLVAALVGTPGLLRIGARYTPRAIRRVVDRCVVTTLVAGALGAPTAAFASAARTASPPVVTIVRDGRATDLDALPPASGPPATAAPNLPAARAPAGPPLPVEPVPVEPVPVESLPVESVVVEPGDNLWEIAARAMARATGRERALVPDAEIVRFWTALCDANRDALASGDVNLIFPGEVVVLPAIS